MSTRGVVGFRYKEQDKVMYNHSDSYPDYLGLTTIEAVRKYTDEQLISAYNKITLVDSDETPSEKLQEQYTKYHCGGVSTGKKSEWYALLREAQGNIDAYVTDAKLEHMINGRRSLFDSLFSEYAYIINLDDKTLEFYVGFNKDKAAAGRYSGFTEDPKEVYYGVRLAKVYTFEQIRAAKRVSAIVNDMNKKSEEEDDA